MGAPLLTRNEGRLFMWLPTVRRWLDLETADLETAMRELDFVVYGEQRRKRDRPRVLAEGDFQFFAPMPFVPCTYDDVIHCRSGFASWAARHGFEVAR